MQLLFIVLVFISVLWIAHGFWEDYKARKSHPSYIAELEKLARLEDELFRARLYLREEACPWKPKHRPKYLPEHVINPPHNVSNELQNVIDLALVANRTTMFISAEAKLNYLQSVDWYKLRMKRMILAGHKCESCGSTIDLQCHHVTYERLTCEHIEDVVILCGGSNGCHQRIHDLLGYDRTIQYPISILKDLHDSTNYPQRTP